MANKQAKQAIGSVLGAVGDAGEAVSATFNTVTRSVGMLNKFVADASDRQKVSSKLTMATFKEALIEEHTMNEVIRKQQIKEFISKDEFTADLFKETYSKFSSILEEDDA